MNRIRKYNNLYQVLITPTQKFNVSFDFILGSWTDPSLMGFKVLTFDNYGDAECEASKYPDINWDQLVDFHKDNFTFFRSEIKKVVDYSEMAVDYIPSLLTPEQTRNKMFDRVLMGMKYEDSDTDNPEDVDSDFRLVYDMNDIISFTIINPWTHNLKEMEIHLANQSRLNLFKKINDPKSGITHMIGRTDIGTTYEIILCPSIIYNMMKWKWINNPSPKTFKLKLQNILSLQKHLDDSFRLR